MDIGAIKLVLPFVAGVFVSLGVALAFAGDRAKVSWPLAATAIAFNLLGFAAVTLKLGYWGLAPFAVGFGLQIWEFARRPGPARRVEVVLVSLLCVIFFALLVSIVLFQVLDRLIEIVDRTMSILERLRRTE